VRKPNPEPFPPVDTPEPKPTPPPGKVLLELKVVQLNYESWWQNCLDVTVGSDQKRIACNKWTSGFGTTRYFFADMPPACNAVKVSVSTFKNQGTNCNTRLKQGLPCNGPYASTPDWTRSPSRSADRPFFFGYDFKTILSRDPLIKFPFDYVGLKSEMENYRDGGANRWLRIFFEDQPKANLDAVRADPSIWHERGIDFNDYIFDVKGENVLFYVEGSGPQGCGGQ
jgi:hypothetical protein